jgi:ArsR family transcriptional regulator
MKNSPIDEYSNIFKALADEKRLRILLLLKVRSLCVCELSEVLETPFSTLSAHLKILRNARLVEDLKDGRWVVYGLAEDKPLVRSLLEMLESVLKEDEKYAKDRSTVANITRELCAVKLREKNKKYRDASVSDFQHNQIQKTARPKGLIFFNK